MNLMNYQWMPTRLLSLPVFMYWEVDEVLPAIFSLILSVGTGKWIWIIIGFSISYLYMKFYKKSSLRITWKDFFFATGIFDLKGYPWGIIRKFEG